MIGSKITCPGACHAEYPAGSTVVLKATAAHGSRFEGWSGACAGTGSCTVTLSQDRAVTARFVKNPPSNSFKVLSLQVSGQRVITVRVRVPDSGTLTAKATFKKHGIFGSGPPAPRRPGPSS